MQRRITDADCLRAAKAALARHLETTPATAEQIAAIAAGLRLQETEIRARAAELRGAPIPGSVWFAGGHNPGLFEHDRLQAVMELDATADRIALQARAWENVIPEVTWEAARLDLLRRVTFYEVLVSGGTREEARIAAVAGWPAS